MPDSASGKRIALVLIEGWADWEYGYLAGIATSWLGCELKVISLQQGPVTSLSGVSAVPHDLLNYITPGEYDAIALIGSDRWQEHETSIASPVVMGCCHDGAVVGAICGGTIALARSGMLNDVPHTSNAPDYLPKFAKEYKGQGKYQTVPHAVRSGRIITAPASAPATFATEFLTALLPDKAKDIAGYAKLLAAEHMKQPADA